MMQIFRTLEDEHSLDENLVLTLGNFDALHLGHQALLQKMKEQGKPAVLTFSNHPSTILSHSPKPSLLSLPHKLHLLESYGVEKTFLLPFTEELSKQTAEEFIISIRKEIPFSHLILGYDAKIGHKREGDESTLRKIALKCGFRLEYLLPTTFEGQPVSSSLIRLSLQEGDLKKVSSLLGRPYSIYGKVEKGAGKGRAIGFRTMNLVVEGLCLPPLGVWAVSLTYQGIDYQGIANLGLAPTLRQTLSPLLEVHIPGFQEEIYDQAVNVEFLRFLRPEKKFCSLEDLKNQIASDIKSLHLNQK
jgi:riboflavin kinase/FMN adenylyltransferase